MSLTVRVTNYQVLADIGINPDEHHRTQPLIVSVEARLVSRDISGIADTVDYRSIVEMIEGLARVRTPLIETFAQILAEKCLSLTCIRRVCIAIDKPFALARGMAGVRLEADREQMI